MSVVLHLNLKDFKEIYDKYKEQGLVVLGFPCNQFGGQEPGSGAEANQNCKINYGVTFLFTKN